MRGEKKVDIIFIVSLLLTGAVVGLASGMLGVGGCFIMVPVQFWVLTSMGVSVDVAIKVAFGTNLLVVLPTAISGAYSHNRKGSVLWKQGIILGITGLVGSVLGATIASNLPGGVLKIIFGIVVILGALRMLTAKPIKQDLEPTDRVIPYVIWGFPLGMACGIIGIGGGVILIPIMVVFLNFTMHKAVGTSTALMIFTSIGGAISYMINGIGTVGLPDYSVGYVNLLQFILLAGSSVPMAYVGAKLAHKIPAKQLKIIFIVVMFYMGIKMTGIFEFLNLPL